MQQEKKELYRGKAKSMYEIDDQQHLLMHFRDDISAFDAKKLANLSRKGLVNNYFNAFIMQKLGEQGVPSHFEKVLSENESFVKRLEMIPVECVIRNIAAGSICKRLGLTEGMELPTPLFEFFYKSDPLGDPLINDEHILVFKWATADEITAMKNLSYQVNKILKKLFLDAGMLLVDYKLEFGRYNGKVLLGDEFTPDGCRIWDKDTREKLDKDRFRRDMGDVVESYEIAAKRLGVAIGGQKTEDRGQKTEYKL